MTTAQYRETKEGSASVDQVCPGIDADDIDRIMLSMPVASGTMRSPEQEQVLPPPAKFTRKDKRNANAPHPNQTYTSNISLKKAIKNVYNNHRKYVMHLIMEYDVVDADSSSESLWRDFAYMF